ncbi:MAG: hypothetical protein HZB13_10405 [Acidobacteria bacterium]|nr:hypothetical protein [Acidobacteriota bacterium]
MINSAPGGLLKLRGRNLAPRYAAAEAVPLPREMAGTMVVVNGLAAPLFEIGEDFVVIQVPYARADQWIITARRGGTESRPLVLASVEALPEIVEVRRSGGDGLEIFATGLGMTDPPALSGAGGSAEEPYHRTILPVRVLISGEQGEVEIEPAYAGLQPWIPARYLVQAKLPAGVSVGQVRIKVGEALSAPVAF